MMKTYTRLLGFARPLSRYTVPYFFYSVLHAVFNTFNYAMIIPILNAMFGSEGGFKFEPCYTLPELSYISTTMVRDLQRHGYDVSPYVPDEK